MVPFNKATVMTWQQIGVRLTTPSYVFSEWSRPGAGLERYRTGGARAWGACEMRVGIPENPARTAAGKLLAAS